VTQAVGDVLRRTGVLGLALAIAVALTFADLVRAFVYAVPMVLIGKADKDTDVVVGGTRFSYYDVVGFLITLVVLAAAVVVVWRTRRDDVARCPDCLSEIPREARVCRYCTSEVQPST
jgi:large conductance mechanosensitive channel